MNEKYQGETATETKRTVRGIRMSDKVYGMVLRLGKADLRPSPSNYLEALIRREHAHVFGPDPDDLRKVEP